MKTISDDSKDSLGSSPTSIKKKTLKKKLKYDPNIKLHFNPHMRRFGEEIDPDFDSRIGQGDLITGHI